MDKKIKFTIHDAVYAAVIDDQAVVSYLLNFSNGRPSETRTFNYSPTKLQEAGIPLNSKFTIRLFEDDSLEFVLNELPKSKPAPDIHSKLENIDKDDDDIADDFDYQSANKDANQFDGHFF